MTRRVLLVDDDADLRLLLSAALSLRGLQVTEAGSVSEAERAISGQRPDIIVVDGMLPDGLGVELIERIRSRDPGVGVVFVSAVFRDLATFKRLTTELGIALVAYKPLDPEGFASQIVELTVALGTPLGQEAPSVAAEPGDYLLELAELRQQFARRLPAKLAELTEAIRAASEDPARLGFARGLAHRLRGSAGSYGYASVGETVGLCEDLLAEAEANQASGRGHLREAELELALRDAGAAVAAAPANVNRAQQAPAKVLLVVDDDEDFLNLVRVTARSLNVSVVTAQTADEALQRSRTHSLGGAILDVHLMEDQSFALARQLRDLPNNAGLSIAFASMDNRIETRVSAMEAGAARFFEKPITEQGLGELLAGLAREADARQPRVLVADGDQEMANRYAQDLRRAGMSVDAITSAEDIVAHLEATQPDILVVDFDLPKISGIDICRALRMSERWGRMPILIVSAHVDTESRIRAFRAGASDVIAKPVVTEELLVRVGAQEERQRLLRERLDKDALSGLLLRRSFVEAFQRACGRCSRASEPLSLSLLDIDHFKHINDTYGHVVGDQVIARLGELLRHRFRTEDLRARWGGEEFVLVFVGADLRFAELATQRLLAEFREIEFNAEDGRRFSVTFTAGVAGYPQDGTSLASMIRCADEHLYVGKRAGRNQVVCSRGAAS